jgi:hypothetical protein
MSKATRWILFLIMVMSFVSLACQTVMGPGENEVDNGDNVVVEATTDEAGTENAAATDNSTSATNANDTSTDSTEDSTESNTDTDSVVATDGDRAFNFRRANAALDEINSYRATVMLSSNSTEAEADTFSLEMELLVTTNPPASSFSFTNFDMGLGEEDIDLSGFGAMTVVQIDGKTYTNLPGLGCTTSEGMDESMMEGAVTRPDELIDDLNSEGVSLVESGVTVNGIVTDHYHFDETAIQDNDASLSTVSGDIYIAQQEEFIVRFVIDGQGAIGDFGDETATDLDSFRMEFNVFDVNSNITITAPAECSTAAASTDYPMLDDAFDVTTFAGVITYKTNTAVADAAAFYKDALTADGWTISFEYSDDTTATMMLTKDSKNLTVLVTEDTVSGGNLVSIVESEN